MGSAGRRAVGVPFETIRRRWVWESSMSDLGSRRTHGGVSCIRTTVNFLQSGNKALRGGEPRLRPPDRLRSG